MGHTWTAATLSVYLIFAPPACLLTNTLLSLSICTDTRKYSVRANRPPPSHPSQQHCAQLLFFLPFSMRYNIFAVFLSLEENRSQHCYRSSPSQPSNRRFAQLLFFFPPSLLFSFSKQRRSQHRYQIVAAEAMEGLGQRLEALHPDRFRFHKTSWGKFPDGTDNIEVHVPRVALHVLNC